MGGIYGDGNYGEGPYGQDPAESADDEAEVTESVDSSAEVPVSESDGASASESSTTAGTETAGSGSDSAEVAEDADSDSTEANVAGVPDALVLSEAADIEGTSAVEIASEAAELAEATQLEADAPGVADGLQAEESDDTTIFALDKPQIEISFVGRRIVVLTSVGFIPDGALSTEWQVEEAEQDFSSPVYYSGNDPLNLVTTTVVVLEPGTAYKARVRHKEPEESLDTAWSSPMPFETLDLGLSNPEERESRSSLIYGKGFEYPFFFNSNTGAAAQVSGVDSVRASLRRLFDTAPGEQFMNPGYGIGLWRYVFEADISLTQVRVEAAIREGVRRWEPRVETITEVRVEQSDARPQELQVSVSFLLIDQVTEGNLVYPFYQL